MTEILVDPCDIREFASSGTEGLSFGNHMAKFGNRPVSPIRFDRIQVLAEIGELARKRRAVKIQPYTFARWAESLPLPTIVAYAKAGRVVTVQPYTLAAWAGGS